MFCSPESLDPRYVFLLDGGLRIFVWYGKKCENVLKSKARLKTEKTNKNEHKNKASIYIFFQGDEPQLFWMSLHDHNNSSMESDDESVSHSAPVSILSEHVPDNWSAVIPRLYIVGLGMASP